MHESSDPPRLKRQFSVRSLCLLILIVALGLGWHAAELRVDTVRRLHSKRQEHAEQELYRARNALDKRQRGLQADRSRSFWEADLEGSNLKGMIIAAPGNAFQRASFRQCNLEDSALEGGAASFQFSLFDAANLARATLKGGPASFQGASFVDADLTGATLVGDSASFQQASFEDAILIKAKLSGNFQSANLSGARLQGADLSAIKADNLASSYFTVPPRYDAATKFPVGFDPVEQLWRRVE